MFTHKKKYRKIDLHKFVPKTLHQGTIHGKIEYIGKPRDEKLIIDLLEYGQSVVKETNNIEVKDLEEKLKSPLTKWIRVTGVHDLDIISQIGKLFNINSLDLEDIPNTTQRPRVEEREHYIFMELNLLQVDHDSHEINNEQVTIIQGKDYVITFHETAPKSFDSLYQRIINSKGSIRKNDTDYLVFAITDIIIDQYFIILEDIGEMLEDTEEELIMYPVATSQESIYRLNRRLVYIKKTIWPTREVLNYFQRSDHPLLNENTRIYFHNLYDHTVQIIETLEGSRDITAGMMDLYLSSVSNRLNEIMKFLTIFSTIFIPLTFVAGVYGMNFKNIPELSWHYGYEFFWGLSILISLVMLVFFRKKRWI
jgi:magnesium transporter